MRVSQIFLYAAASGAALAQTTLPACFGSEQLLSCVAAPLSVICTEGDNAAQASCACSEVRIQSQCYDSFCSGNYPSQEAAASAEVCSEAGMPAGNVPAQTTPAGTSPTGGAGTTTASKADANVLAPAGGLLAAIIGAVAYL